MEPNDRVEPELGSGEVGYASPSQSIAERFGIGKRKTADQIVEDALEAFNTAVKNLDKASDQIETQVVETTAKIAELTTKLTTAQSAKDRLARVKERFVDLIS